MRGSRQPGPRCAGLILEEFERFGLQIALQFMNVSNSIRDTDIDPARYPIISRSNPPVFARALPSSAVCVVSHQSLVPHCMGLERATHLH